MSAEEVQGFPARLETSFTPHLAKGTWPRGVDHYLRIALAPTPDTAAIARAAARELAAPYLLAAELDETLILLSELVANAARHPLPSGEQVEVHLGVAAEQIRVEVYDAGAGFDPVVLGGRPGDAGGWGLVIVDRAASRWGSSNDRRGHCVWFELDRATPLEATG